ncbi:MAG: alpha-galactosidase [Planctomycetota bacterium]|nr:alpha-galactosidase [Planctomycetota bacterium]
MNSSRLRWLRTMVLLVLVTPPPAGAISPVPDELLEATRFVRAALEGVAPQTAAGPGLEVVTNYDSVQKNTRFGKPLKLASQPCTRGIFCHAPSKIVVRLPGPGKTFAAQVGLDTNEQTAGGRGSVVFSVDVGTREVFRSDVLREGMPPASADVELGGATEFVLQVGDSGDGISCDQADWAEAKITLADGRIVWLDELPVAGGPTRAEVGSPLFSFTYGDQPSSQLLKTWKVERNSKQLDQNRTQWSIVYTDPQTGLVVRCVAIAYHAFPTVEWTVTFQNAGPADTPILANIQALDLQFARGHYGEFLLHHAVGSPAAVNDYQPLATELFPKTEKRIGAAGGRPTNSDLSYFNLEVPTGSGVIIAVGWPGQWSSLWTRDDDVGLRVRAGQELTHLKLLPGEEIRTPLIALQFWTTDWIRGQNIWRRWMLAHNVPRPNGKLPKPELFGCSSHLFGEMVEANEENQKMCIDRYAAEGIPIGHWWIDAGWYPCAGVGWPKTGTWEVDRQRFPRGLRAISDHAHAKGLKTIVWFEPERVHADTWLTKNHPEWVLGGAGGGLLNLGHPPARQWLTERVDGLLTDEGIDLYRQDFNMDPLSHWRSADPPDRQGITEIRHVEGYLAYWDALLQRHPGMFIDTCASGGRRNDLETLRRAIPLWRTDYRCEPLGTQCCTYGISLWIPLSGTGAADVDTYTFRSNMTPFTNCLFDIRSKTLDYNLLRRLTAQWRQIAEGYCGDFYPLTEYSITKDSWMAWQFDRPETGEGFVQAFRREKCIFEVGRLKLHGLLPDAQYEVIDLDAESAPQFSGRELTTRGLLVSIPDQPGAVVIRYRQVK